MKLIKEDITLNDLSVISEGAGDNKRMFITGPFFASRKRK